MTNFFEFLIIFAAGVMFTMIIASALCAVGTPKVILLLALALISIVLVGFIAYKIGFKSGASGRK